MSNVFSEKEEKILKTFEKTIPKMTELEREKLLSFGEGILFVKEKKISQLRREAIKMLETVDETIEKLCGFIQEGLESDLTANDCGNLPDLIKALAELISARAINY